MAKPKKGKEKAPEKGSAGQSPSAQQSVQFADPYSAQSQIAKPHVAIAEPHVTRVLEEVVEEEEEEDGFPGGFGSNAKNDGWGPEAGEKGYGEWAPQPSAKPAAGWRTTTKSGWEANQKAQSVKSANRQTAAGWNSGGNAGGWGDNAGGDDGWGDANDDNGWGEGEGEGGWGDEDYEEDEGWGNPGQAAQLPPGAPSWMTWGAEAQKLTSQTYPHRSASGAAGTRANMSPQQRTQILNSLLHQPNQNRFATAPPTGQPPGWNPMLQAAQLRSQQLQMDQKRRSQQERILQQQQQAQGGKKSKKNKKTKKTEEYTGWGDAWDTSFEEDDPWGEADDRRLGSMYDMPSKALAYARQGTDTSFNTHPVRNQMQDYADVKFVESRGAALMPIERALYSKTRPASTRFHWLFPPDKDERVASLLSWIQSVSYGLGTFGLHKFLQSRERGALVVNADFTPEKHPDQPAFDWLTFDQIQPTMDQVLQESVAYYDPAVQVIVFVLLPSASGNSVAIWRRKIAVPNNIRLAYQSQIKQALAALRKEYVLHVDQLPTNEPLSPMMKNRRKLNKGKKGKKPSWWKRMFFIEW